MCVSPSATKVFCYKYRPQQLSGWGNSIRSCVCVCVCVCMEGDGNWEKKTEASHAPACVAKCTLWHSCYAGVSKSLRLLAPSEPPLNPGCVCTTLRVWSDDVSTPANGKFHQCSPSDYQHRNTASRMSETVCERWTNVPWAEFSSVNPLLAGSSWRDGGALFLRLLSKCFWARQQSLVADTETLWFL